MDGERGSTARQRMTGKICWECRNPLQPDPHNHCERLCAKCTEARQPLRDVYMYYMLRDGWYCQFLEADLKTALPRTFTFATPEKVVELAERGRGLKDLTSRRILGSKLFHPSVITAYFSSLSHRITMALYRAGVWSVAKANWFVLPFTLIFCGTLIPF